jgi:hypothetical protein
MKTEFKKLILVFILFHSYLAYMQAQDFEVSPVKIDFTAEPGQTQTIPLNILNHSSQKSTFIIQLGDFVINKEGAKINMPQGTTEHSLVNWMSINPPLIELNPNEAKQIMVSIQAPAGDYTTKWANIFVTNTIEQTASIADKALKTGVLVQGQILVRARQSPRSNINYKMKITNLSLETSLKDSVTVFSVNIDNMGDKITDCKVVLLGSNLNTAQEKKIDEINFESYPDSQLKIKLRMNKGFLQPGKYAMAAILDYGNKANLEGAQMLLDIE